VPAKLKKARRSRVMGLQKRLVTRRQRARIGERARIVVDGPSSDHDLVLKGRLASQAPDIDASVFLTDCDPSSFKPGDFADVAIVGSRGYDLLARPLA
jgi:ribosomal protein S12 methylthiotransferase